jgi:hypothetical protein
MGFPRTLLVEMQLSDGLWVDITRDVRQADPVTISRGSANEQAELTPSACTFTLLNTRGDYTPRNPLGVYYGKFGRNTPVRVFINGQPRFNGEAAKWSPGVPEPGALPTVKVTAAGILRRLMQGEGVDLDSLRRYVPTTSPRDYWPMDDAAGSQRGLNAVSGRPPMTRRGAVSIQPEWGKGEIAPWLSPGVKHTKSTTGEIAATSHLRANCRTSTGSPTSISVGLMFRGRAGEPTASSTWWVGIDWLPGSLVYTWEFGIMNAISGSGGEDGAYLKTPWGGSFSTVGLDTFLDGFPHYMFFRAVQAGANVQHVLYIDGALLLDNTSNTHTLDPIFTDVDITGYTVLNGGEMATSHLTVWDQQTATPSGAANAAFGYSGEAAGNRVQRLCTEEGLSFSALGTLTDSVLLGSQFPGSVGSLLADTAISDAGILYEPRDSTNDLAYRTRNSVSAQLPSLVLDYEGHQIAPGLVPIDDDQRTRNDWTVKRKLGGQYRLQQTSGPLNVAAPPAGVGAYTGSLDSGLAYEADLPHLAGWLLNLGTIDESRWPEVTVYLDARGITAADDLAAMALDLGSVIELRSLRRLSVYDSLYLVVRGYTEVLDDVFSHTLSLNCAPFTPYRVMKLDDSITGKLSGDSTLATGVSQNTVAWSVTVPRALWTTDPTQYPITVMVEGEEIRVLSAAGSASPQILQVARGLNGVSKPHAAGVRVAPANRLAL